MKSNRNSEVKVGITVFVALLILVWVIIWVKNISLFEQKKQIKIEFTSVPGLEEGDPVTINGVRAGRVSEITLKKNSAVVDVEIPKNIKLASDAKFSLYMLDMMGGKKISIFPGNSESEMDYSRIQTGYFPGDISTAIAALNSVQSDLVVVVKDVKKSLNLVNDFMANGDMRKEILESLQSLQTLTGKVSNLIDDNKADLNALIKNGNNLINTTDEIVQNNKSEFSDLLVNMNDLVRKSKVMIDSTNLFLKETKNKKNNVGKILYDEEIYQKLNITLSQLQELTKIFIMQLKNDGLNVDANIF